MYSPVLKSRVSKDVLHQLVRLVVNGSFAPGDRLPPERELAEKLSVTRNSLRDALRQMENMGLVRIRQGDGNYVTDWRTDPGFEFVRFSLASGIGVDAELILGLEEIRRTFALKMIELAATRITDASIARLRVLVSECPAPGSQELLSGEWDFSFYREIARATGNRVFLYMLNTVRDIFGQLRGLYAKLDESFESIGELNRKLVDALETRDGKQAVALVEFRMRRDMDLLTGLMLAGRSAAPDFHIHIPRPRIDDNDFSL